MAFNKKPEKSDHSFSPLLLTDVQELVGQFPVSQKQAMIAGGIMRQNLPGILLVVTTLDHDRQIASTLLIEPQFFFSLALCRFYFLTIELDRKSTRLNSSHYS